MIYFLAKEEDNEQDVILMGGNTGRVLVLVRKGANNYFVLY